MAIAGEKTNLTGQGTRVPCVGKCNHSTSTHLLMMMMATANADTTAFGILYPKQLLSCYSSLINRYK